MDMKRRKLLSLSLFLCIGACLFQSPKMEKRALADETASEELVVDNNLASTYYQGTVANNLPTVIVDIESKEQLTKVTSTEIRPSNVILHFNKDQNIIDKEGNVIDSFINVYAQLNKKILPIVYIENQDSYYAFVDFFKNKMDILDLSIMSDTSGFIKGIKDEIAKYVELLSITI